MCLLPRLKQSLMHFFLLASLIFFTGIVQSHEIRPSIIDIMLTGQGQVDIKIDLNLEALIAEIGPYHSETTESANAAKYDQLRRLSPQQLTQSFNDFSGQFMQGIALRVDGKRINLLVAEIAVAEVGDTDLARSSRLQLQGQLPANSKLLSWQWDKNFGAAALRISTVQQQDIVTVYLRNGAASDNIPLTEFSAQTADSVFKNYIVIGFTHIIPKGLDHILFVVGLFLLSIRISTLIWQVSSFTLAHSITLAMAMLGVVQISPSIVEPLIAASIVYVCSENIFSDRLNRWRPVIVFVFGLLHGLGFAGVLADIGLSSSHFLTGLLAFNIGVELGQLVVIALCFLTVGIWFHKKPWYRQRITTPISLVIAGIGSYWMVERTLLS